MRALKASLKLVPTNALDTSLLCYVQCAAALITQRAPLCSAFADSTRLPLVKEPKSDANTGQSVNLAQIQVR